MANVFANHQLQLEVKTKDTLDAFVIVKGVNTFNMTIDGNVYEYNPADLNGWTARFMTGKNAQIAVQMENNPDDDGQGHLTSLALETGENSNMTVKVKNLTTNEEFEMEAICNVTQPFGGSTTDASVMEVTFLSTGKPTYGVPTPPLSTKK